ncbi:FAD-binding protein [Prochlorococcus marinus]|uniref:FAD-binding protein n=1 Tax=Prochlorococcus marinus TaxID=1219 RepID=UPI0022B4FEDB|nr:FAD-binding protein [Prochlorococcus marinus]
MDSVNSEFFQSLKSSQPTYSPFLVSSGGTTSRAAADKHWILDLRKNYQNISFDLDKQQVEIEAGVNMGELSSFLKKHKRSFPIGLSGKTGMGYLLTGGISPLSRGRGLAIDQIMEIKGFWGNGKEFHILRPKTKEESSFEWKALCGAAIFLGIITKVKLKTQPLRPLLSWTASLSFSQLSECVNQAESWPNSLSFQWIYGEDIFAHAIGEIKNSNDESVLINLLEKLPFSRNRIINKFSDMNSLPNLSLGKNKNNNSTHSEVLGLLGPAWQENNRQVLKILQDLMNKRPNKSCYIASQQLGGLTHLNNLETSFIHRDAVWKPWINGAWEAYDQSSRKRALDWMRECWYNLEFICPGVHLAQIHPHLEWHQKELSSAFKDWLPKLQELKAIHDPKNIMPPLR